MMLSWIAAALSVAAFCMAGLALARTKRVGAAPLPRALPAAAHSPTHRYTLAAFDVNGTQLAPLYEGDDDTAMALAWRKAKQATTPGDFYFLDARCRTHRGRITRR